MTFRISRLFLIEILVTQFIGPCSFHIWWVEDLGSIQEKNKGRDVAD